MNAEAAYYRAERHGFEANACSKEEKSRAGTHRRATSPPASSVVTRSSAYIEPPAIEAMISEAAGLRVAHRGFEPGHEVADWRADESEIDGALSRGDLPQSFG